MRAGRFPSLLWAPFVANWKCMARTSKSQWDFGELFSPDQTRRVLSVSELTTRVKRSIEQQVGTVWVTGEISNFRAQASGHFYFTLKDANTQLACVLFRGTAPGERALLGDGQKVILQGEVTVYEARGQYQLIVRTVELQGAGALQAAFERLKRQLAAEGLFASERKRSLPRFPQRIGLVTSPTGAAVRDVLHAIQRRNPALEIVLVPCRVQGEGAAGEIASAIGLLNEFHLGAQDSARQKSADGGSGLKLGIQTGGIDLILVTRGGGSLEDLWAFNEEVVARAMAASVVPVVSAVGHEIDFTIADFAADLRAATPSAAAEIITEGVYSSRVFIADAPVRLHERVRRRLAASNELAALMLRRLARLHPRRRLEEGVQRFDDLRTSLGRGAVLGVRNAKAKWQQLGLRIQQASPAQLLHRNRDRSAMLVKRLSDLTAYRMDQMKGGMAKAEARLRLLGPAQVLARGYSITMDAVSGEILREAGQVRPGQHLRTRLKRGEVMSVAAGK
jgi:exodeoxyribonuclease VII large subunit